MSSDRESLPVWLEQLFAKFVAAYEVAPAEPFQIVFSSDTFIAHPGLDGQVLLTSLIGGKSPHPNEVLKNACSVLERKRLIILTKSTTNKHHWTFTLDEGGLA